MNYSEFGQIHLTILPEEQIGKKVVFKCNFSVFPILQGEKFVLIPAKEYENTINNKHFYDITITVDTNDVDYISNTEKIDKLELDNFMPLIESIKNFKPYKNYDEQWHRPPGPFHHNFPYGEMFPKENFGEKSVFEIYNNIDEDTINAFLELCPSTEYGFHTIVSIEITPYVEKTKLL